MYATILTVQLQPGTTDEAIRILRETIAPMLHNQHGFKSATLMGDCSANQVTYITFWDTAADVAALDNNGTYRQSLVQFAQLFAAPPAREAHEVLFQFTSG